MNDEQIKLRMDTVDQLSDFYLESNYESWTKDEAKMIKTAFRYGHASRNYEVNDLKSVNDKFRTIIEAVAEAFNGINEETRSALIKFLNDTKTP